MKYCVSIFVKCDVPDVVKCLQDMANMIFEIDGKRFTSKALLYWIEISETPESILSGTAMMADLGISGQFFDDYEFNGFNTMIDITCSAPSFATSLLPLADSIAAALSQEAKTVCLVMDDDGDQMICEYHVGSVSRTFALPPKYIEGLYWQPNLKHESQ